MKRGGKGDGKASERMQGVAVARKFSLGWECFLVHRKQCVLCAWRTLL